jgi:hypothetical protein
VSSETMTEGSRQLQRFGHDQKGIDTRQLIAI